MNELEWGQVFPIKFTKTFSKNDFHHPQPSKGRIGALIKGFKGRISDSLFNSL
jgi:hypothetical protein